MCIRDRHYSNKYEWEADAFSKKLMGGGEPLAQGLEVLEKETIKFLRKEGIGDVPMWKAILGGILNAHPSTEKRTAELRR